MIRSRSSRTCQGARGEEIEDPVGQVLAQRVLLVFLVALAMRAQLQRPGPFEHRSFQFLPRELDSERDEGAVARHEAKMAARAQLDRNGAALAIAIGSTAGKHRVLAGTRSLLTILTSAVS